MINNNKNSKEQYRKPTEPLKAGWSYIGNGKANDPSIGSPEMSGRWTIKQKVKKFGE